MLLPGCREEEAPPPAAGETRGPPLTAERLPPGVEAFSLGESTEADLLQVYSTAERTADHRLDGTQTVEFHGRPAIELEMTTRQWLARQAAHDGVDEGEAEHLVTRAMNVMPDQRTFAQLRLWLTPDDSDTPRLTGFEMFQPRDDDRDLCRWAESTFGDDPEATRCPGQDVRLGRKDQRSAFCAADARGMRNILVECERTESLGAPTARLTMRVLPQTR